MKIIRNVNLQDIFEKLVLFSEMIVTPHRFIGSEDVRERWICG